ncbi:MAG: ribonuclease P protein component [Pseudomonadota bacterium]
MHGAARNSRSDPLSRGPVGCGTRERFPPSFRLRKPNQFRSVFRRNRRSHDRFFTVLYQLTRHGHARLGMAVSRKACGNAVVRNHVKRQIRESFRRQATDLPPVDIVVIVKPGAGTMTAARLSASLARHWEAIRKSCAR